MTKPIEAKLKNTNNKIKLSSRTSKSKGLCTSKNWRIERARDLSIGASYHDLEANQV